MADDYTMQHLRQMHFAALALQVNSDPLVQGQLENLVGAIEGLMELLGPALPCHDDDRTSGSQQ